MTSEFSIQVRVLKLREVCGSVVEHVPCLCKALGATSSIINLRVRKGRRGGERRDTVKGGIKEALFISTPWQQKETWVTRCPGLIMCLQVLGIVLKPWA